MSDEDEEYEDYGAIYEGSYSQLRCGKCEINFEEPDDVSNGDQVDCPNCGQSLHVEGR